MNCQHSKDPCYPRSNLQTLLPHARYWKQSALGLFGVWDRDYEGTGGVYMCDHVQGYKQYVRVCDHVRGYKQCVRVCDHAQGYYSYNLQLPGGQTSQCAVEM